MRWLPRSLYARMLALSLAATLVALALAGWAIAGVLERFVVQGLDRRLDGEVALLAGSIDADGHVDRERLRQQTGALGGEPGWRWRIVGPDGTIGSADFPPLDAGPPGPRRHGPEAGSPPSPPPVDGDRLRPLDGGDEHGIRVHGRMLTIRTRRGPVVLTAAAPRAVVQRPIRSAMVPLFAALATLAALLTGASLLQLQLGLRPIRRLRDQIAAIRTGARTRVDEEHPAELQPLAVELNALAEANAASLATARASAANLAHALKNPIAALALELHDQPAPAAQVARIDATLRHHLARARATAVNLRASTPLEPAVDSLIAAVRRQADARHISIEATVAAGITVMVDAHDLDELIGNLLDNAVRHASHRVRIAGVIDEDDARWAAIHIADDGPGIPAADRTRVTAPGVRLDERDGGHGFGLSIVSELSSLYGGKLELAEAPAGGLIARLLLPAARQLPIDNSA